MKYNPKDKESIYEYAKELKGKSFHDLCDDYYSENNDFFGFTSKDSVEAYTNTKRKGSLGQLVEEMYFNYKANNESKADFSEAGVELKVTPYKINKNGSVSAKERLIISMIDYMAIVNMDFFNSNAWEKIKNILLVYYLWNPNILDKLDYLIHYVYMYTPIREDLEIIKTDFEKIKEKIMNGQAHNLSEGDTLYLGAATKASSSKNRTTQPFSVELAKPRAFSLKQSYMTYILRNYVLQQEDENEKILKNTHQTDLENLVLSKINREVGKSDKELIDKYFDEIESLSKDVYSRLAFRILGVKSNNAEEFVKANIVVKAIRVEENNTIRESMSFPTFVIKDLVEEEWEESSLQKYFESTKFLFVVYKKKGDQYFLQGAKFWNMPRQDIDGILKEEWERIQRIFIEGVKLRYKNNRCFNNLPKMSETEILHVRPHARKSVYKINGQIYGNGDLLIDGDELPNGDWMPKQCFWLNKNYVKKQVSNLIESRS